MNELYYNCLRCQQLSYICKYGSITHICNETPIKLLYIFTVNIILLNKFFFKKIFQK